MKVNHNAEPQKVHESVKVCKIKMIYFINTLTRNEN